MTVTSGVIQFGCAACVAETMSSQDSTPGGGGLKVKGPFGAARAGSANDGSVFCACAPNGASAIAAPGRRSQPSNSHWMTAISRVVFHVPRRCNGDYARLSICSHKYTDVKPARGSFHTLTLGASVRLAQKGTAIPS